MTRSTPQLTKPGKILIIDDEKDIRHLMQEIFEEEGYQVVTAANGLQAQEAWQLKTPDIIFLDIWMPDIDGITLLKRIIDQHILDQACVIMMSGHGTIDTAIEATKLGAYDFLEKPLSLAKLLITAERAMTHLQLHSENRQLKQKLPLQILPVGKSKMVAKLRETIERLAKYTMPVLVSGEAGVGKHHFAQAIHKLSPRKNKPLWELNCANFDDQAEAGLDVDCNAQPLVGQFLQANGGTLILSQIDHLSTSGQDFLLTLLQHKHIVCPTNQQPIEIDLRIITLTQDHLENKVQSGEFNEELYQRLKAMPVEIPALRQHTEDIPELIHYFLDYFLSHDGLQYREFSPGAQNVLRQYSWPGNFRELQNLIQRLLILGEGIVTDEEAKQALEATLPSVGMGNNHIDANLSLKEAKDQFERAYFKKLLIETGSNVTETAKRSGVERTNLYRKLKALDLDPKNPK